MGRDSYFEDGRETFSTRGIKVGDEVSVGGNVTLSKHGFCYDTGVVFRYAGGDALLSFSSL